MGGGDGDGRVGPYSHGERKLSKCSRRASTGVREPPANVARASSTASPESHLMAPAAPTVVAIVWTHNRYELAERCVTAVLGQTRPPDRVIVVDIASPDGSGNRLRRAFHDIEVIELTDNDGPGAALAAALEATDSPRPDYYWLVEDDSLPAPECLEATLQAASAESGVGILGPVGCELRWGQWYATPELPVGKRVEVDFVVLDGALLAGPTVEQAGLPKTDYFIMMVDVEYPLRIAALGFRMVQAGLPYQQLRLGSASPDSSWRHYYQTRNHLRMAIELRSATLIAGFIIRTLKHIGYAVTRRDWNSIRLRTRGIGDGVRHRMGRTLEPPGASA